VAEPGGVLSKNEYPVTNACIVRAFPGSGGVDAVGLGSTVGVDVLVGVGVGVGVNVRSGVGDGPEAEGRP